MSILVADAGGSVVVIHGLAVSSSGALVSLAWVDAFDFLLLIIMISAFHS